MKNNRIQFFLLLFTGIIFPKVLMSNELLIEEHKLKNGDVYLQVVKYHPSLKKINLPIKINSKKQKKQISFRQAQYLFSKLKEKFAIQSYDEFMFINKLVHYERKHFLRDYPIIKKKEYGLMSKFIKKEFEK